MVEVKKNQIVQVGWVTKCVLLCIVGYKRGNRAVVLENKNILFAIVVQFTLLLLPLQSLAHDHGSII